MSTVAELEVAGVSARYAGEVVLRDISMQVDPGDIIGVAGANGAGKSSLLRVVSGLLPTVEGDVRMQGISLRDRPAYARARLGIAHVPEGRGLFGDLTVLENLRLGALGANRRGNLDRVLDAFPHLRDRLAQRAGSLSGGEQQMVAIGRGLMADPKLLLIDELSLGLAPKIKNEIYQTLRQINAESGMSMLLVDQDLQVLRSLARCVYVLQNGRIALTLRPDRPQSEEDAVGAYLGFAKKNG